MRGGFKLPTERAARARIRSSVTEDMLRDQRGLYCARRRRSPATARFASTCREYFARSFGAITQEQNGAKMKLNKMTIGRRLGACSDKRGIERTIVAPIPNNTALTIMLNSSDIENLVDIGTRLRATPCRSARGKTRDSQKCSVVD